MKIEVLFPEIADLYGDLWNVKYLARCCADIELVQTTLKDTPLFVSETPALIYMGTMTERNQELALQKLLPYRDRLRELIESDALFLVTGNASELFGRSIEEEDGTSIPCLGLFPFVAKRHMTARLNCFFLGKFNDTDIVGFKSQFTTAHGADESMALFTAVRGIGMNPDTSAEGIRYRRFHASYLIGPLTVLNPPFAAYLLREMGADGSLAFEETALSVYRRRIAEFSDPGKNPLYH